MERAASDVFKRLSIYAAPLATAQRGGIAPDRPHSPNPRFNDFRRLFSARHLHALNRSVELDELNPDWK
ncbi:hypothetical protein [Burkholderia gladioli]|uniref:hypothetical protein n=1 Tax=Burkholderia gladioli TaxID=28095 RepID=UPI001640A8AB|nr:hypothetical protein [Burkholderia gladioli]